MITDLKNNYLKPVKKIRPGGGGNGYVGLALTKPSTMFTLDRKSTKVTELYKQRFCTIP